MVKICTKCGKEQPVSEFYKRKGSKDGFDPHCKRCHKARRDAYYKKNKTSIIANQRAYRQKNKQRVKDRRREYYQRHKEATREYNKAYYKQNKQEQKDRCRKYYQENRDRLRELGRKWYYDNQDIVAGLRRRYNSKPRNRIRHRISTLLQRHLLERRPSGFLEESLGYTIDALCQHLESQFRDGMSWENMGDWHIDHIIPVRAFNFKSVDDDDFKRCYALKNLQPLWAHENLSKGGKLDKPFQPSLCFTIVR